MSKKPISLVCTLLMMALNSLYGQVITEIMYNPPEAGVDSLEYIEIYNNTPDELDLSAYSFSSGFDFTFYNNTILPIGEFVLVAVDSVAFEGVFGVSAFQMTGGGLSNGGELIILVDADDNVVDTVNYNDDLPWPLSPDGEGASLVLCDVTADNNDGSNWNAATTGTGFFSDGIEVFGSPGVLSSCPEGAVVRFLETEYEFSEADGTVNISVEIRNATGNNLSVDVEADMVASTVDFVTDVNLVSTTLNFNTGNEIDTMDFTFSIIDDGDIESPEILTLNLSNASMGVTIDGVGGSTVISITDNDAIADLVINEIMYNPPGDDALYEYIELYNNDNVAINLDGYYFSDGIVDTLHNVTIQAGSFLVLAVDSVAYTDTYGGMAFQWTFGSLNSAGETIEIRNTLGNLVDVVTYSNAGDWPEEANGAGSSLVLCDPNADNSLATRWIAGVQPAGFCISGTEILGSPGIANDCTPPEPTEYTVYTIGEVTSEDSNGEANSLCLKAELTGIVYGVNLRPGGAQFTMIDEAGDGIVTFSSTTDFGYNITEGDEITVQGAISQFSGLTQIALDTIFFNTANNTLHEPLTISILNEETESRLVKITATEIVNLVNSGGGWNIDLLDGQLLRVDNDTDITLDFLNYLQQNNITFDVIGLGWQFDPSEPYFEGYQLWPRYLSDFIFQETIDTLHCGNTFVLNDITYDSPGVYEQTLTASMGNDSLLTINLQFTASEAPEAQIFTETNNICIDNLAIDANLPNGTTGEWTAPLDIIFNDPNSPNTTASGLSGSSTISWTLSTAECLDYSTASLTINAPLSSLESATIFTADTTICQEDLQLTANLPNGTTGQWTATPNVDFTNPNSANTIASGFAESSTLFWTLSTAECPDYSTTSLTINAPLFNLESADILLGDTTICQEDLQLEANLPNGATGQWTATPNVNFTNSNLANTTASGFAESSTLFWTLSTAECPDYSTASLTINAPLFDLESATIITENTTICQEDLQLEANLPNGASGQWTATPNVNFTNPNLANTTASGFTESSTLFWTLSTAECPDYSTASLTINAPSFDLESANILIGDTTICQENIELTANLPNGTTGEWTATPNVNFTNPNSANTTASGFAEFSTLFWTLSTAECPDYSMTSLAINAPLFDLESANILTGDTTICQEDLQLTANLPNGTTGQWTNINNVFIAEPFSPSTWVGDFSNGMNTLQWKLSTDNCPNYSLASITINYVPEGIFAQDDQYLIDSTGVSFFENVIINDSPQTDNWSVELLEPTRFGLLSLQSDGSFFYEPNSEGLSDRFSYILFNEDCIGDTDTAFVELLAPFLENNDPVGFSPNGDGYNDQFIIPELIEDPSQYGDNEISVINRWGQIVFYAKPYNNDWDGRHYKTGEFLPASTYFYNLQLDVGRGELKSGMVVIMR